MDKQLKKDIDRLTNSAYTAGEKKAFKTLKTVGLYSEGKASPRIEYRIMEGDEDITGEYNLFEPLIELLKQRDMSN